MEAEARRRKQLSMQAPIRGCTDGAPAFFFFSLKQCAVLFIFCPCFLGLEGGMGVAEFLGPFDTRHAAFARLSWCRSRVSWGPRTPAFKQAAWDVFPLRLAALKREGFF